MKRGVFLLFLSIILTASALADTIYSTDFEGSSEYHSYDSWSFSSCTKHTEAYWTSCFDWDIHKNAVYVCTDEDRAVITCSTIELASGMPQNILNNVILRCCDKRSDCWNFENYYCQQDNADSPHWHLRLRGNGNSYAKRTINTTGYKDVEVKFDYALRNINQSTECFKVYHSPTGSPPWSDPIFNQCYEGVKHLSYDTMGPIPTGDDSDNNPNFAIKFEFTGRAWDETAAFLDDVVVTGIPCGADGENCASAGECCGGYCCGDPGTCKSTSCCSEYGDACSVDEDCCIYGQGVGGCDDESSNKVCFQCASCSGYNRCSSQEPNECESQCGASPECDDKQVDSYLGTCGYGNQKREDRCDNCLVTDGACEASCGADLACDELYPGSSCGSGETCSSSCTCLSAPPPCTGDGLFCSGCLCSPSCCNQCDPDDNHCFNCTNQRDPEDTPANTCEYDDGCGASLQCDEKDTGDDCRDCEDECSGARLYEYDTDDTNPDNTLNMGHMECTASCQCNNCILEPEAGRHCDTECGGAASCNGKNPGDSCSGGTCNSACQCVSDCADPGDPCGAPGDCCSGNCCDGLCCAIDTYCCDNVCQSEPCCGEVGENCTTTEDCCEGECCGEKCCSDYCCDNVCQSESCCKDTGEPCENSGDCCSGYCCGGFCQLDSCGECTPGAEPIPCEKNLGVCVGLVNYCTVEGTWSGCNYSDWSSSYQETESNCDDGLDNDCDGKTDCGTLSSGADEDCEIPKSYFDCYEGDLCWFNSCGGLGEKKENCTDDNPCTVDNCSSGACVYESITECLTDYSDGCCPSVCTYESDIDCGYCTSDSSCDDSDDCTLDRCEGGTCRYEWVSCGESDGCCVPGCSYPEDPDCEETPYETPGLVPSVPPEIYINQIKERGSYLMAEPEKNETIPVKKIVVDYTVISHNPDSPLICQYKINEGEWHGLPLPKNNTLTNFSFLVPVNETEKGVIHLKCTDGHNQTIVRKEFPLESPDESEFEPLSITEAVINSIFPQATKDIDEEIRRGLDLLIALIIGLFLIILLATMCYSKLKASQLEEKIEREKEKEKEESLEELEQTRVELSNKLRELKKREVSGLSAEEVSKEKAYTNELVIIEEKLLKNEEHFAKLDKRADKAFEQAESGVSSKEIRKRLVEEGYSQREIKVIQNLFKKRKTEE